MDHRQGRHHPGLLGLRDHRGDREHAERALPRAHRRTLGDPAYARIDAPATSEQKAALGRLSPDQVSVDELAGEPALDRQTAAPGNGEPLGGLKVITASGWFAARPSGTEDVYKLYAELFRGPGQLARIQEEAQQIIATVLKGA